MAGLDNKDNGQMATMRPQLRILTCGSVDDGKSTLIGRLLYDADLLKSDQRAHLLEHDNMDFASLVDGLAAEREQGITIDVAYRYVQTPRRKFIIADTPGHEQYTRNMATGASTADLAVILVDGRNGLKTQTRRHSYICALFGIKHVVLAVNKMDLVSYAQSRFNNIEEAFRNFCKPLGFQSLQCIPLSAKNGDNITKESSHMDWYRGPSLLTYLETIDGVDEHQDANLRFPVQYINRGKTDFRGLCGTLASGEISIGDDVIVLPAKTKARIREIVTFDGPKSNAQAGQAVTLCLEQDLDVSRGDMICHQDRPASVSGQIQAKILWMSDKEMLVGRQYYLRTGNKMVAASISNLKYILDINDLSKSAGKTLALNEIGICTLALSEPIVFDKYEDNRTTGSFILIDRLSNETIGAGMIEYGLHRAANVVWQDLEIGRAERALQKHQKPAVLWFTGLSGSGKSTIANLVEKRLYDMGRHTYILDGDNVRHGLNKDLGFTDADRVENIRRVSETARLMADAGLMVLVSFISPFRAERRAARRMMGDIDFIEIYVNTPLEIAEARDVKGLYAKARAGLIKNFTGIDSEYQAPMSADIVVDTAQLSPEQSAEKIVTYLETNGFLNTVEP